MDAALKARARQYGETVKRAAEALSNGPMTRQQQRTYSPGFYSTARLASPYADAIINKQTGLLAASWFCGTWAFSGHVTVTVWNTAPEAKFMLGTVRMRKRDVLGRAMGQITPFSVQMLQAKRQGERSVGGSLVLEIINVAVTVGVSYGGAAAG